MQRLDDEQVERILAMVDASAAAVAPDERDDSFDDYADLMRTERILPGTESHPVDDSAAGLADALIFLGMGLTFLGHVAFTVLNVATNMAIERGVENAVTYLRKKFRKDEIVDHVMEELTLPPEVDPSEMRTVIVIQVTVLLDGDDAE
ncbi:hypothetical protein ACFOY4_33505 [Actinomadura syzygii]|uniref:Uncharacterized protein n=1 Tax=Actinomadura syzygii TaxID=1427538 RepID=A0A5D0U8X6_9ACTN|nr:hypothetical protein [Actinomadura syzygii]TYC15021.1 hypothetical protein FXF65_12905 [Actinomadura syzygii]